MAILIPPPLVEFILLGPMDDRRQLQDSPILGDVWVDFAKKPADRLDLLISPCRGWDAGVVAEHLEDRLTDRNAITDSEADVAYLQGLVVARLVFEEVLTSVVPLTKWWIDKFVLEGSAGSQVKGAKKKSARSRSKKKAAGSEKPAHGIESYSAQKLKQTLEEIKDSAWAWFESKEIKRSKELLPMDRFVSLAGLILWAGRQPAPKQSLGTTAEQIRTILSEAHVEDVANLLADVRGKMLMERKLDAEIWQISRNRNAVPALTMSIPAVKADAATTLFKVNCRDICWAVIDSGIDGGHDAFQGGKAGCRIKRSFDFQHFRRIVSMSNSKAKICQDNAAKLMKNAQELLQPPKDDKEARNILTQLATDVRRRGPIHWELVERFVEIHPNTKPPTGHGTHVAGIIGANKEAARAAAMARAEAAAPKRSRASRAATPVTIPVNESVADGMCPDIQLYDFRVLGPDIRDTEFAIIAAMQFIRYLNDRDNFLAIHGANLSLSIPHDVRNYACGRTPICDECERLIENGVVVVAAAGNHGYKSFETQDGSYEGYTAFSITDPGNADGVITVGATHRFWPHTYGVSFFSSRGPTGDGRLKPDLVAPGERICAPLPGDGEPGGVWGDLDGTSMAAPHVSGAAAMLLARYSELIGQPRRIKQILCENATDLGRERSFQGHGMLDVLRAFQAH